MAFNSQSSPVAIKLTDMKGRTLWEKENVQTNILQVPVTTLAPGIYFITVSNYLNKTTVKLVKQ